jgi:hypothetical protein
MLPLPRKRCTDLIAELALTLNRRAAARIEQPVSHAASITRLRKSSE